MLINNKNKFIMKGWNNRKMKSGRNNNIVPKGERYVSKKVRGYEFANSHRLIKLHIKLKII